MTTLGSTLAGRLQSGCAELSAESPTLARPPDGSVVLGLSGLTVVLLVVNVLAGTIFFAL